MSKHRNETTHRTFKRSCLIGAAFLVASAASLVSFEASAGPQGFKPPPLFGGGNNGGFRPPKLSGGSYGNNIDPNSGLPTGKNFAGNPNGFKPPKLPGMGACKPGQILGCGALPNKPVKLVGGCAGTQQGCNPGGWNNGGWNNGGWNANGWNNAGVGLAIGLAAQSAYAASDDCYYVMRWVDVDGAGTIRKRVLVCD